jgi:hypothetical protein
VSERRSADVLVILYMEIWSQQPVEHLQGAMWSLCSDVRLLSAILYCQTGLKCFGCNLYQSSNGLGSKQQITVKQNTKDISLGMDKV